MTSEYTGQVVVVAGGAQPIGRAIAEGFHRAGASVLVADVEHRGGHAPTGGPDARDQRSSFLQADVTDRASVESLAKSIDARFGRADVLINCSVAGRHQHALAMTRADWAQSIGVILSGAFYSSQALAPIMAKQKKGAIVNVVSMDAYHAFPGRSSYAAAETGLLGLTRALAVEWAGLGIRVNALAHSMVSPEHERSPDDGKALIERLENRTPMHRLARPEEIAAAALFLAGTRAGFMTGQVLRVDGGWAALNSAAPGLVFP